MFRVKENCLTLTYATCVWKVATQLTVTVSHSDISPTGTPEFPPLLLLHIGSIKIKMLLPVCCTIQIQILQKNIYTYTNLWIGNIYKCDWWKSLF